MLSIPQANIDKFQLLLETETDAAKRALIIRLIGEQRGQLAREQPKPVIPETKNA